MKTIAVINGPNLNRLGRREPSVYGTATLRDLEAMLRAEARKLGVRLVFFQSNHEGALIDRLEALADRGCAGIIINPGGLAHTSVVLRDAIAGTGVPAIEVHISDIRRREAFRRKSITAGACQAMISGRGFPGYVLALRRLAA